MTPARQLRAERGGSLAKTRRSRRDLLSAASLFRLPENFGPASKQQVFDFAPDRALRQIADYSCRSNVNEASPEKKVEEFISFLPVSKFGEMLAKRFESTPSSRWASGLIYLAATVCLLLSCASLTNSGYNPFIYFRF